MQMLNLLSLPRYQQAAEIEKIRDLRSLANALIEIADQKGYDHRAFSIMLKNEEIGSGIVKQQILVLLKQFPEVPDLRLPLDIDFDDEKDRMDAIIDGLNQKRIPLYRYHELIHRNFFDEETGISRTFLAYALPKLHENVVYNLKKQLEDQDFAFYAKTLNYLNSDKAVPLYSLYLQDHGDLNLDEREAVKNNINLKSLIQKYTIGIDSKIVRIDNIDTHNIAAHMSANKAHATAFNMMLKAHSEIKTHITATGEIKRSEEQDRHWLVEKEILDLKNQIDKLIGMKETEIYDVYLRHEKRFQATEYTALSVRDKTEIDRKIKGLQFKAGAAERYLKDMIDNHQCGLGMSYKTNVLDDCGLTMEKMVAAAHWASRDSENFKDQAATLNGNFLLLVDQIYDMKRGYNIDNGTDKPDELIFPQYYGVDLNRCLGGCVNSLSWALASVHKAYNPKKIEGSDIEREIKNIYEKIIEDNIDAIATASKDELRLWSFNGQVSGNLKINLYNIFETQYKADFEKDFDGYVSKERFAAILENGLSHIAIPEQLREHDIESIYRSIQSDNIPLLYCHKECGYTSTLNYLSTYEGNEDLINELFGKIRQESDIQMRMKVLRFLSRSNLSEEYKQQEIMNINGHSINLNNIAPLTSKELEILSIGNVEEMLKICMKEYYENLLTLLHLNTKLIDVFLYKQYGDNAETIFHRSVRCDLLEIISISLKAAGPNKQRLLEMQDSNGYTPLHVAFNINAMKILLEAAGENKQQLLEIQDQEGRIPIHTAILNIYRDSQVIKILFEAAGENKQRLFEIQDHEGHNLMYYAVNRDNIEIIKMLIEVIKNDPGLIKNMLSARVPEDQHKPERNFMHFFQPADVLEIFNIKLSAELGEIGSEKRKIREIQVLEAVHSYLLNYGLEDSWLSPRSWLGSASRIYNKVDALMNEIQDIVIEKNDIIVQKEIDKVLNQIIHSAKDKGRRI